MTTPSQTVPSPNLPQEATNEDNVPVVVPIQVPSNVAITQIPIKLPKKQISKKQKDHLQKARETKRLKSEKFLSFMEDINARLEKLEQNLDTVLATQSPSNEKKRKRSPQGEDNEISESIPLEYARVAQKPRTTYNRSTSAEDTDGSSDVWTNKFILFCATSIATVGGVLLGYRISESGGDFKRLPFDLFGTGTSEVIFRN
jgi:hypothetical protein